MTYEDYAAASSIQLNRQVKARRYALLGVAHCWIVDPEARRLECFSLREGAYQATAAAKAPARLDSPGLAGLTIDLGSIFK